VRTRSTVRRDVYRLARRFAHRRRQDPVVEAARRVICHNPLADPPAQWAADVRLLCQANLGHAPHGGGSAALWDAASRMLTLLDTRGASGAHRCYLTAIASLEKATARRTTPYTTPQRGDATVSDTPDIVARLRDEIIRQLQWVSPEVIEAVLLEVATVSYRGDVDEYLSDAMPVYTATLTTAMQPTLDAMRAKIASHRAKADLLEEQFAKWQREFEGFRQMKTSKTIQ